jgi:hypothetical protein
VDILCGYVLKQLSVPTGGHIYQRVSSPKLQAFGTNRLSLVLVWHGLAKQVVLTRLYAWARYPI